MKKSWSRGMLITSGGNDLELLERWEKAEKERREQEHLMQVHFDYALLDVAIYFGVATAGVKKVNDGPLRGAPRLNWDAKFYDDEQHLRKVGGSAGEGDWHYLRIRKNEARLGGYRQAARIQDDGEIAVRLWAFELMRDVGDPALMADVLYHEQLHYDRLTGPGCKNKAQEEVDVYEEEIKGINAIFGPKISAKSRAIRDGLIKQAEERRDHFQREIDQAEAELRRTADPAAQERIRKKFPEVFRKAFTTSDEEYLNKREFLMEEEWKGMVAAERTKLKARLEQTRRERDRPGVTPIHDLNEIVPLAVEACLTGRVSERDVEAVSWFPMPGGLYVSALDRGAMSPCVSGMLDNLVGLNEHGHRLTVAWLTATVDSLRKAPVPIAPRANVTLNLAILARSLCRDPGSITPDVIRAYLASFPDGQHNGMDGPRDCMKDLYGQLISFNMTWSPGQALNPDWLVYEARRLRQQYSSPPAMPPGDPGDERASRGAPNYNHCIDPGQTCLRR